MGEYDLDASTVAELWAQVEKAEAAVRLNIAVAERGIADLMAAAYSALAVGKVEVGKSGDDEAILVNTMDILRPPPKSTNDVDRPLVGGAS